MFSTSIQLGQMFPIGIWIFLKLKDAGLTDRVTALCKCYVNSALPPRNYSIVTGNDTFMYHIEAKVNGGCKLQDPDTDPQNMLQIMCHVDHGLIKW